MTFYLYDANTSDALQLTPQNPQFHLKSYKFTPPCLKFSLSSMKKTSKNTKGRGEPIVPKGRGEGGGRRRHTVFLFIFEKRVNVWVASQEALIQGL